MNKKLSFFSIIIILFSNIIYSQDLGKCALSQLIKKKQETDKFFFERVEQTKQKTAILAKQQSTNAVTYIIPVVFHILHLGGNENISNEQVLDAMKHMNDDFRKRNEDTIVIVPEFIPIAADCEIDLRLATLDPDGNCTNGIIRHYTTSANFDASYQYSGVGPGLWDPNKYMNIYVCRTLDFPGAAAYTYLPGWLGAGNPADAIVSLHTYVGGIGTASQNAIHVLSHEVGHWLGLSHVWGDTNDPGVACGDDGVNDTPITKGWSSCNLNGRVCNPAIVENVQNFMEYSYCDNMFTEGQKQLMHNVIATGANAGRDYLVSATNLQNTGVTNIQVCAPVADFTTVIGRQNFCANQNIQFKDNTQNAPITSWNWNFPGASPNSSTDSIPTINYASPGIYAVSYTATNVSGNSSITKTSYIEIVNNSADFQSLTSEGFEAITVPDVQWRTGSSTDGITWSQNTSIGATGTNSMMINNFANTVSDIETLYTPSYNLAAINTASAPITFKFKLAHQLKTSNANERLQVYSSTNCGQTWSLRYSKSISNLATVAGVNTSPYVPSSAADWRTETVGISALLNSPHVLFKFVFTSDAIGNSNNIYIDDINISQNPVGINELAFQSLNEISVVPNPSNGQNTILVINTIESSTIKIEVLDVLGKQLFASINRLKLGENSINLFNNMIPATGIYFVKLSINGQQVTKKIIIE